jgi:hypothetical protein
VRRKGGGSLDKVASYIGTAGNVGDNFKKGRIPIGSLFMNGSLLNGVKFPNFQRRTMRNSSLCRLQYALMSDEDEQWH